MVTNTATSPFRVTIKHAADLFLLSTQTVNRMANAGVFTVVRGGPTAHGRRLYLLPAEVKAYATGGLDALAVVKAATAAKS